MAAFDSIGIIELVGLATAIECADAAVKAANVRLLGYELSRGAGMVTVKISGNVSSVQAGVSAGAAAAEKVGKVVGKLIIPRPHRDLDKIIFNKENVLAPTIEVEEDTDKSVKVVEELAAKDSSDSEDLTETDIVTEDKISEDGSDEDDENEPVKDEVEDTEEIASCNICNDPLCPRQKGEARVNCIHYTDDKK